MPVTLAEIALAAHEARARLERKEPGDVFPQLTNRSRLAPSEFGRVPVGDADSLETRFQIAQVEPGLKPAACVGANVDEGLHIVIFQQARELRPRMLRMADHQRPSRSGGRARGRAAPVSPLRLSRGDKLR